MSRPSDFPSSIQQMIWDFFISPGDARGTTRLGQNIQILFSIEKNSPRKNQNNKIHPNLVDMFVRELVRLSTSEQEVAVD